MTYIPPKIYTVDTYSLGGVYMAAAYVSNFKIDSIGTTRKIKEFSFFGSNEVLMPEAYKVTITFRDLVSQSSNIFAGTMGGSKVEVSNIPDLSKRAMEFVQSSGEAVTKFVGKGLNAAGQMLGNQEPPSN